MRHSFFRKIAVGFQIFVVCVVSQSAYADPVKNVTYAQFELLVRESVTKIPDLKNLWVWQAKGNEPVYFGGGALRGLLRWLEENLRTQTFEQVRAMPVPNIQELLILQDADRDLFHDRVSRKWFQANFPEYGGWDILEGPFYRASIEAGGPPIEKVRVNPSRVEDPYGGIQMFYEGKMGFVNAPDRVFEKFRLSSTALKNNYKIALVLRALRFSLDLPSTKIDDATFAEFRKVAQTEAFLLPPENYWVMKALRKLHQSTKYNDAESVELIRKAGLLQLLASKSYRFGAKGVAPENYKPLFAYLSADELTPAVLGSIKATAGITGLSIQAMEIALKNVKSASEFLQVVSYGVPNPGEVYRTAVSNLIKEKIDVFLGFKPAFEEVNALRKFAYSLSVHTAVTKDLVARATNANEFIRAFKHGMSTSSQEYFVMVDEVLAGSVDQFKSFHPDAHAVFEFKALSSSLKGHLDIANAFVAKSRNVEEYWNALKPGVDNPSMDYIKGLKQIALDTGRHYSEFEPNSADLNLYFEKTAGTSADGILHQTYFEKLKLTGSMKDLLKVAAQWPNLLSGIDTVRTESLVEDILKWNSSFEEIEAFVKLYPQQSMLREHAAALILSRSSSAEEFIERSTLVMSEDRILKLFVRTFERFGPTPAQYNAFIARNEFEGENRRVVTGNARLHFKNPDELAQIDTSSVLKKDGLETKLTKARAQFRCASLLRPEDTI